MTKPLENLGAIQREIYRDSFRKAVANGEAKPLLLPLAVVGTFVIPILYLTIPHASRPWLYRARFAVMAVIVALEVDMMRTMSSLNNACAYVVGMAAVWGILWNLMLLVWTRPQFEAERVQRRLKRPSTHPAVANGDIQHCNGQPSGKLRPEHSRAAPDEDIAKSLEDGYEYYWQAFPAEAPFLDRLDWAVDLSFSFRGGGWNCSEPSIPRFQKPEKPLSGELVKLKTIPLESKTGYQRCLTHKAFIRARLTSVAAGYMVLDFCSVYMVKDPYFIYGPSDSPLPPALSSLNPIVLQLWRGTLAFAGILAALHMMFSLDHVVRCLLLRPVLRTRSELWHYPSIFGSFVQVLDRGLAGFWGAWWHQTFRIAFTALPAWLFRHGYLDRAAPRHRALAGVIVFAHSGLFHAAGGATTVPETKSWVVPFFFLLSWVGIVLQEALCALFRTQIARVPRAARRATNLLYVLVWLLLTNWAFIDDLSRCGLWLYEPVPISPLRFLGLGATGDSWWRWDRDLFPSFHVGKHWWDCGIAL